MKKIWNLFADVEKLNERIKWLEGKVLDLESEIQILRQHQEEAEHEIDSLGDWIQDVANWQKDDAENVGPLVDRVKLLEKKVGKRVLAVDWNQGRAYMITIMIEDGKAKVLALREANAEDRVKLKKAINDLAKDFPPLETVKVFGKSHITNVGWKTQNFIRRNNERKS